MLLHLAGCDRITPPYREDITPTPDTTNQDTTGTSRIRKVLLEEFTGINCGNCPTAGDEAKRLKSVFGSKLVIMAVHEGGFARPHDNQPDFRTESGKAIDQFFGVSAIGVPSGLVNRYNWEGSTYIPWRRWYTVIDSLLKLPLEATINIRPAINNNNLSVAVSVTGVGQLPANNRLVVAITESKIIAYQKDYRLPPPSEIPNFEHNYVFRGNINATWGEAVNLLPNQTITKNYSIQINSEWKVENLHIIAYLYDGDTKSLRQVEEVSVQQ
jgi:hypothetical protein